MKKKLFCLVLALVLVVAMSSTAFAKPVPKGPTPVEIAVGTVVTGATVATGVVVAKEVKKVVDEKTYTVKVKSGKHGVVDQLTPMLVLKDADITVKGSWLVLGKQIVKATPALGYVFDGWEGIPEDGKVSEDFTVKATFKCVKEVKEELQAAIDALTIRCNTAKEVDGINVITTVVEGDVAAVTDAGYKLSYKLYRSAAPYEGYEFLANDTTGTYKDAAVESGNMYYYKAELVVTNARGKVVKTTALENCKYGNRAF